MRGEAGEVAHAQPRVDLELPHGRDLGEVRRAELKMGGRGGEADERCELFDGTDGHKNWGSGW